MTPLPRTITCMILSGIWICLGISVVYDPIGSEKH